MVVTQFCRNTGELCSKHAGAASGATTTPHRPGIMSEVHRRGQRSRMKTFSLSHSAGEFNRILPSLPPTLRAVSLCRFERSAAGMGCLADFINLVIFPFITHQVSGPAHAWLSRDETRKVRINRFFFFRFRIFIFSDPCLQVPCSSSVAFLFLPTATQNLSILNLILISIFFFSWTEGSGYQQEAQELVTNGECYTTTKFVQLVSDP